jgi:hypothetical protein
VSKTWIEALSGIRVEWEAEIKKPVQTGFPLLARRCTNCSSFQDTQVKDLMNVRFQKMLKILFTTNFLSF